MYRLPIARPDETLYSLVGRIRLANTARCDRDACRSLLGPSMTTHVDEFPVDLTQFCQVTKSLYGRPLDVLMNHCTAPYFLNLKQALGSLDTKRLSPLLSRYSLAHLSNAGNRNWRLCPSCIAREKKQWGMTYWHRMHQLPGAMVCAFDDAMLFECDLPKPLRHNRFIFPDDVNAKRPRDSKVIDQCRNILCEIANLNASILFEYPTHRDLFLCRSTILNALSERGLLARTGTVRRKEVIDDIVDRYKSLALLQNFAIDTSSDALSRLVSQLSENAPIAARHQLLLIHHLFGTWERFQSQYKWIAAFTDKTTAPTAEIQEALTIREKHRAVCLDMINEFPSISRSQFSRAAGKSFRWLLQNDSAWLNRAFPKRQGKLLMPEQKRLEFFFV